MNKIDFRSMIIGLLGGVCIFLMMGQNSSNMGDIKVNSISVIDGNHETLYIGSTVQSSGLIQIYNKKSNTIVALGASTENHGLLRLNASNGTNTAFLGSSTYEDGLLTLNNQYDNQIVYIGSNGEHHGMMIVSDRYGEDGWGGMGTGSTFPN